MTMTPKSNVFCRVKYWIRRTRAGRAALFGVGILAVLLGLRLSGSYGEEERRHAGETCYDCHDDIEELHRVGKHLSVLCSDCHGGLADHLENMTRPQTRMDHAACGRCHKEQYASFVSMNPASKAKAEKATYRSKSPLFDKLIAPHGFGREHTEPRSHVFMLVDHLIVDRAYGGRFQLKDWTRIDDAKSAEMSAWSVLQDKEPATSDQKLFLPQTATAANAVCVQCKSQDHILDWAYMGDAHPNARWKRGSNVIDLARQLHHPANCFMCHDPHSAQPRVVRDALIEAVADRNEGTYPYDREKSRKTTLEKRTFRDYRAIGLLNRADSNLLCAQCHVEYNCNPGHNPETGASIGMDDRRTNLFPWVNVFDYNEKMADYGFKDFRHAVTGTSLSKIQHPDVEVFWNSTHERSGVECKNCHMPKVQTGDKAYTWHGQRGARYMKRDTCLACHRDWTEPEAEYKIEAIQHYVKGKLTKAEFWLGEFIDAFQRAKDMGVEEDILRQAGKFHDAAHTLWEWWAAENSYGFHNPDAARQSLTLSIDESQKGIEFLNKAIAGKR